MAPQTFEARVKVKTPDLQ